MASYRNSNHSQGSKPVPLWGSTTDSSTMPPWEGGIAMLPNLSNQSNSSSFTMSSYDGPSTPVYGYDQDIYTTAAKVDSGYQEQYSSSTVRYHGSQRQPRHTPSTLRWLPDCEWVKLYSFIVKKGAEPYLQLQSGCDVTSITPETVYLDPPARHLQKLYPCQFPGCPTRKPFNRPADLERHYRNVHADDALKERFYCDYPKCDRSEGNSFFTRKDHCRDHLRDYHKEDIGQAKRTKKDDKYKWERAQEKWLAERTTSPKWWRCSKCLSRIQVDKEGWECRRCNHACESDRKIARRQIKEEDTYSAASFTPNCSTCNGTAWIENRTGGWDLCPNCSPTTSSEVWDSGSYSNYSSY